MVTGGASGLRFAIAERLNASGAKVVIWDLDGEAGLAAGKQLGGSSIAADVSDLTSATNALQKTLGLVPTIDNASTTPESAGLTRSCGSIRSMNGRGGVEGTFYCCRAVVPLMRERNYGRIVSIASVAGKDGNPNASAYVASKAAVIRLRNHSAKNWPIPRSAVDCR